MIVPRVFGQTAGIDVNDAIAKSADEVNVVADEDQGSFVLLKRFHQGIDTRHIEVSSRFVHQQEVGRIKQDLNKRKTALFTTAENRDFFEDIVSTE